MGNNNGKHIRALVVFLPEPLTNEQVADINRHFYGDKEGYEHSQHHYPYTNKSNIYETFKRACNDMGYCPGIVAMPYEDPVSIGVLYTEAWGDSFFNDSIHDFDIILVDKEGVLYFTS